MFILKSTHNKILSEESQRQYKAGYATGFRAGEQSVKQSTPTDRPLAEKKVKKIIIRSSSDIQKKKLQRLRKARRYYAKHKHLQIDGKFYIVENGVRVSTITGKPVEKYLRTRNVKQQSIKWPSRKN